jgi:hypothetical protein
MVRLFGIAEKCPFRAVFKGLSWQYLREVDHSGQKEQAGTGIYSHAAKNAQETRNA